VTVAIPVTEFQGVDSTITDLKGARGFVFVQLGEGMEIEGVRFKEDLDGEPLDYIVTPERDDDLEEAFDLGARALLAPRGSSVEEIVEAMMFRELDEIR